MDMDGLVGKKFDKSFHGSEDYCIFPHINTCIPIEEYHEALKNTLMQCMMGCYRSWNMHSHVVTPSHDFFAVRLCGP
jgi:hypothetical protein